MKATLTNDENQQLEAQQKLIKSFQHIPDLKTGDVLKCKQGSPYRSPNSGEIIVVYSVLPSFEKDSDHCAENDFTAICTCVDGIVRQFELDSRHFERIEIE